MQKSSFAQRFVRFSLVIGMGGCTAPQRQEAARAQPPAAAHLAPAASRGAHGGASEPTQLAPPAEHGGTPCGPLACRRFDDAATAFRHVLQLEPEILGVGESHAQRGDPPVPSATERMARELLPLLASVASDLVLELWVARGNCGQLEAQVKARQEPVTQSQSGANQDEFVALGRAARQLGITPHALEPSCAEYKDILAAGPGDIARMLQMIAERTAREVKALHQQQRRAAEPKLVIAYGGAIHNDLNPRPGREDWSFGPELSRASGGRYVEVDLIVPEFVKDTEAWRGLPWYPHFDKAQHGEQAVLFNPEAGSYTLIFPASRP